ncbi:hypothetical protein [Mycobacterium sp. JS623]|uniref:hypothetical protein n=1 Tax=Mycobacterium sp. JS623 TaxID=212767 RepID=UPI0012F968FA|nr:hypothetical protein [Mycobacterium sp. JS623]
MTEVGCDLILGALPGNTDAIRPYERRGYRPTWLYAPGLTAVGVGNNGQDR